MTVLRALIALALVSAAYPAAADQWYEHYARAEKALVENDHATAVAELNEALERRGDSGARVRTYGMRVVDYFPYLRLGIAYVMAEEYEAALRAFDTEEQLGAVAASEEAAGQLERFRRTARDALERQRAERQREVDALVERNLADARRLRSEGRPQDALAAVDRALAVSPDHPAASALAESLREDLARSEEERQRRVRAERLVDEGEQLRADGRLADAAARFRRAVALDPESPARALFDEVQHELAEAAAVDHAAGVSLEEVQRLVDGGDLDAALAMVQVVLANRPGDESAVVLQTGILEAMAAIDDRDEIRRLMTEAERRLAAGDLEGSISTANLVLAKDRGHREALDTIRQAYSALSRRLVGGEPRQNLPPAIRFADLREPLPDGTAAQIATGRAARVSGVVIDDSEVSLSASIRGGSGIDVQQQSQAVGEITITEFRLEPELAAGLTILDVVATDADGQSTRSEYALEYRPPVWRTPAFAIGLLTVGAVAVVAVLVRRRLRRLELRRKRFNPFTAGPPILDPRLFVGRDRLIDRVLATVPNNSLLLLGERRIGKTSTLLQLRTRLPELDHPRFTFVPVPVDLQGVPEELFFATVAEAVGEAVGDEAMARARAAPDYDSRELMRDLRRVLPTLVGADGKTVKLVLLLDEIDELNGYSHRTNQRLRSLFMRSFAEQLVAVAAGVGIARDWDHEGSPWYNFFEEIEVGPMDAASAKRLVTEPLEGMLAVDDEAVDRMLELARGRPYILQKLALAAVQRAHEGGRGSITIDDVTTDE